MRKELAEEILNDSEIDPLITRLYLAGAPVQIIQDQAFSTIPDYTPKDVAIKLLKTALEAALDRYETKHGKKWWSGIVRMVASIFAGKLSNK